MRTLQVLMLIAGVAVTTASCQERAEQPPQERPAGDLLQGAPLFQPAYVVGTQSSAETYELTLRSPSPPDSVANWYRDRAEERGWEILGDVRGEDGSVSLTFRREGPGLWLMVRPGPDGEGTEFNVIAAAPDTTQRQP